MTVLLVGLCSCEDLTMNQDDFVPQLEETPRHLDIPEIEHEEQNTDDPFDTGIIILEDIVFNKGEGF